MWFAEKDGGATRLYPLTDYEPRKGEALEQGVSVNIFFTIFTNVPPPFPPMIFYRSRQRTSAAFGQLPAAPFPSSSNARSLRR